MPRTTQLVLRHFELIAGGLGTQGRRGCKLRALVARFLYRYAHPCKGGMLLSNVHMLAASDTSSNESLCLTAIELMQRKPLH